MLVDHGDQFRAGQLLAEMDPVDLDECMASAAKAQERFGADRAGVGKQRAQYRLHSPVDGLISSLDSER